MVKNKIIFSILFLIVSQVLMAQQPFKRFKPIPERVDQFDHILSVYPFKFMATRINLAWEMRLGRNYTFKVRSSQNFREPFVVNVENLEVSNRSDVTRFNEQNTLFLLKRYKTNSLSRVYFGPYIAAGIEATRTRISMIADANQHGFDDFLFKFSTRRKSVIFALGTTKLFSKNIIIDLSVGVKYAYKIEESGKFAIRGLGYKKDFSGVLGFSIGMPVGKRLNSN